MKKILKVDPSERRAHWPPKGKIEKNTVWDNVGGDGLVYCFKGYDEEGMELWEYEAGIESASDLSPEVLLEFSKKLLYSPPKTKDELVECDYWKCVSEDEEEQLKCYREVLSKTLLNVQDARDNLLKARQARNEVLSEVRDIDSVITSDLMDMPNWIEELLRDGVRDKRAFREFMGPVSRNKRKGNIENSEKHLDKLKQRLERAENAVVYTNNKFEDALELFDLRLANWESLCSETEDEKKVLDAAYVVIEERRKDREELNKDGLLRFNRFDGYNRKLLAEKAKELLGTEQKWDYSDEQED